VYAPDEQGGLAKFVLDEREYVVLILSRDGALAVSTLHYSDEILPMAPWRPKPRTRKSTSLKKHKADDGRLYPGKYSNGRRQKLLDIVNKKARKKDEVEAPEIEEEEKAEGMADLMTALEKACTR